MHFRAEIKRGAIIAGKEFGIISPCARPITYSLGTFDARFGISKESFIQELDDAVLVWESPSEKDLFAYAESGGTLKVNLIYDDRQSSTQELNSLSSTIDQERDRYDRLRKEYSSLNAEISTENARLESLAARLEADKKEYEAMVSAWNRGSKKSKSDYDAIQATKADLERQIAVIQKTQSQLNARIKELNSLATSLNTLAKQLNLKVNTYNSIGAGESFDEGEYVSDRTGERINIYQYSNALKLDRVLAHEFGHALGMDHVSNEESIMFEQNSGSSILPSEEDMAELIRVCKL
jgi:predicted  nucleic acid-binding Zn-ribbon protein